MKRACLWCFAPDEGLSWISWVMNLAVDLFGHDIRLHYYIISDHIASIHLFIHLFDQLFIQAVQVIHLSIHHITSIICIDPYKTSPRRSSHHIHYIASSTYSCMIHPSIHLFIYIFLHPYTWYLRDTHLRSTLPPHHPTPPPA